MRRRTIKAALAMALAGAGLAAALPLSAQTPQAPADTSAGHHMMGGDRGAMMKMMGEMADACRSMMQGGAHERGKDTSHPQQNPPAGTDDKN